jgi:hypothetical protein
MKILLGFKSNTQISYSNEFASRSITSNDCEILYSGTLSEIKEFVKTIREKEATLPELAKKMHKLETTYNLSEDEFDAKLEKLDEQIIEAKQLKSYSKLLIIDGEFI